MVPSLVGGGFLWFRDRQMQRELEKAKRELQEMEERVAAYRDANRDAEDAHRRLVDV